MNVASKESIGREPRRQLPGKCSSDVVCTVMYQPCSNQVQG